MEKRKRKRTHERKDVKALLMALRESERNALKLQLYIFRKLFDDPPTKSKLFSALDPSLVIELISLESFCKRVWSLDLRSICVSSIARDLSTTSTGRESGMYECTVSSKAKANSLDAAWPSPWELCDRRGYKVGFVSIHERHISMNYNHPHNKIEVYATEVNVNFCSV